MLIHRRPVAIKGGPGRVYPDPDPDPDPARVRVTVSLDYFHSRSGSSYLDPTLLNPGRPCRVVLMYF
jgi:hypothetical protein